MKPEKLIEKIVQGIWSDLCDRSGYDLGCLDEEIQESIRESWRAIVVKNLNKYYLEKTP